MGDLINSIQHLFVTIATIATTVVMVISPIHKSAVIPTPTIKQEIQSKTATSSATPTNKPTPTLTPTEEAVMPKNQTQSTNSEPTIDCIGPDGKTIELTQKRCNDFNVAWGKQPSAPTQTAKPNTQTNNANTTSNSVYYVPYNNNTGSYPSYIIPTYPPVNTDSSQQIPTNTPIPVNNSLNLQTCLSNAESYYNSQMEDLNRRGFLYSGQADQVRNNYASQQQSCRQQYGN